MHGLLSARELDRATIDDLLRRADRFRDRGDHRGFAGSIIGLMFYSDSLRTRVGFEAAAARLGATAFVLLGARQTPAMSEPESVYDAARSIASWCDVLCLRHPEELAAARVAGLVDTPVINCGNGADEHPTQTLIDLFAIEQFCGRIDGVRIAIVGDLHGMRVAHSLMIALGKYNRVHVRCISPPGLEIPVRYAQEYAVRGNALEQLNDLDLSDIDIIYVAGLPRQTAVAVPDPIRRALWITPEALRGVAPAVRVLCPLPRIDEIQPAVDALPHAAYFLQSSLGLPMRMAILEAVLGTV